MSLPKLDPAYLPIMKRVRVDKHRWNPLRELLEIGVERPESISGFVVAAMQEFLPIHGAWVELLEWLPEQVWPELLKEAVPAMIRGRVSNKTIIEHDYLGLDIESMINKIAETDYDTIFEEFEQMIGNDKRNVVAEAVVTFAAGHFPRTLHPWLKELFEYNLSTMNSVQLTPFRLATPAVNDFLWDILYDDEGSVSRQATAFYALLESYSFPTIEKAVALAERVDFNGYLQERFPGIDIPERSTEEWVKLALQNIAHETEGSDLRQLFNPTAWHLQLAHNDYTSPTHPTWDPQLARKTILGTGGVKLTAACDLCHGPLARLLTVPPEINDCAENFNYPSHVDICPSCAGFLHVYFQLNDRDQVKVCSTEPEEAREPQENKHFADKPLKIRFSQLPERWFFQEFGTRGSVYRLGGVPSWIQSPEYPSCPSCERTMTFFMQHILGYPVAVDETTFTPSDGMMHYFWCESCRVYLSRFQMS